MEADSATHELHTGLNKIINLPETFKKGNSIVQLIQPCVSTFIKGEFQIFQNEIKVTEITAAHNLMIFYYLLQNVDISSSGVYFQRGLLHESVVNAIDDCSKKRFRVLPNAIMQTDRTSTRVDKLISNGWINNTNTDTTTTRVVDNDMTEIFNQIFR